MRWTSIKSSASDYALRMGFRALELNVVPDWVVRASTRQLLAMRLKEVVAPTREQQAERLSFFAEELKAMPIAINAEDTNGQHYEVPTEFYRLVLGKHLKYSASRFPSPGSALDEAEEATLELYCERAQLRDGQAVLDLGCGWGSLALYVAAKYPRSEVTGVSYSATQRAFIEGQARERGITNLTIVTSDINDFEGRPGGFDRVLSIEMFEHMKNYAKLMRNCAAWLNPGGLLFVHCFVHATAAYHFQDQGESDWLTRNFFSGGTMMSNALLLYFQDDLSIERHWVVSGTHYARTSEEWLKRMDAHLPEIRRIFAGTYGAKQESVVVANWRTFFMAVAEMFAYNGGEEWFVAHYLFKKRPRA